MDVRDLWTALVRVIVSILCGGAFYFVWMAAYLLAIKLDRLVVETVLWLLAPVVTAGGFAAGIVVSEHLTGRTRTGFFRIFIWPMIGCAIGAGAVYWFGPMLIVFGMFVAGTASVALREMVRFSRGARS